MSLLSEFVKLEKEVDEYAQVAGKDIETIVGEIKTFIVNETTKFANTNAAKNAMDAAKDAEAAAKAVV